MKRAGDLLSTIIDDNMMGKAREYSRLFSTWEQLAKKYRIAAAANHSRIQDLKLGILLVEADHPGWIQILQTKENELLTDLRKAFPDLGINGIGFKLSSATRLKSNEAESGVTCKPALDVQPAADEQERETPARYDEIKNDELKDLLKSLKKSIAQRDKRGGYNRFPIIF